MKPAVLRRVVAAQNAGSDVLLATRLADGAQELIEAGGGRGLLAVGGQTPRRHGLLGLDGDLVADVLRVGESRTVETPSGAVFLRPYIRAPRLIVIGAVHIAQGLVPMGTLAGFRVTVLDPREGFATRDRFPGAELVREWPDQAMAALELDGRTAIVALTHDPKIDDPALQAALESDAFYIGALGSRKTQKARRERLGTMGFSSADVDRIHGPIGLPIGARTPEEIAVAVLAQVIGALRL